MPVAERGSRLRGGPQNPHEARPHLGLRLDQRRIKRGEIRHVGGARSALEGANRIREHVAQAKGRLIVMPGAGIAPSNIARVAALTGASELHASAKRTHDSRMRHRPADALGMGDGEIRTDADEVRALVDAWAAGAA